MRSTGASAEAGDARSAALITKRQRADTKPLLLDHDDRTLVERLGRIPEVPDGFWRCKGWSPLLEESSVPHNVRRGPCLQQLVRRADRRCGDESAFLRDRDSAPWSAAPRTARPGSSALRILRPPDAYALWRDDHSAAGELIELMTREPAPGSRQRPGVAPAARAPAG